MLPMVTGSCPSVSVLPRYGGLSRLCCDGPFMWVTDQSGRSCQEGGDIFPVGNHLEPRVPFLARAAAGLRRLRVRRRHGHCVPLEECVAALVRASCGSGRLLRRLPEANCAPA
ncbi:hypothetical protein NDU88_000241 [Pleurodeles waltl]|uniref:Uncharacterized protein n=1 Tax=Pleurodeles waltl TaxID=8319 RepID=A0AAV7UTH2_PLEWA|nr:hypothetical protein NDU88_000241 [Pleurodeles waltl]